MKFLADENIPRQAILSLRQSGRDVLSVQEISPGMKDIAILELAVRENRILLTFDKDFGHLVFHKKLPAPIGIVLFRFVPQSPSYTIQKIVDFFSQSPIEENHFIVVEDSYIRMVALHEKQ